MTTAKAPDLSKIDWTKCKLPEWKGVAARVEYSFKTVYVMVSHRTDVWSSIASRRETGKWFATSVDLDDLDALKATRNQVDSFIASELARLKLEEEFPWSASETMEFLRTHPGEHLLESRSDKANGGLGITEKVRYRWNGTVAEYECRDGSWHRSSCLGDGDSYGLPRYRLLESRNVPKRFTAVDVFSYVQVTPGEHEFTEEGTGNRFWLKFTERDGSVRRLNCERWEPIGTRDIPLELLLTNSRNVPGPKLEPPDGFEMCDRNDAELFFCRSLVHIWIAAGKGDPHESKATEFCRKKRAPKPEPSLITAHELVTRLMATPGKRIIARAEKRGAAKAYWYDASGGFRFAHVDELLPAAGRARFVDIGHLFQVGKLWVDATETWSIVGLASKALREAKLLEDAILAATAPEQDWRDCTKEEALSKPGASEWTTKDLRGIWCGSWSAMNSFPAQPIAPHGDYRFRTRAKWERCDYRDVEALVTSGTKVQYVHSVTKEWTDKGRANGKDGVPGVTYRVDLLTVPADFTWPSKHPDWMPRTKAPDEFRIDGFVANAKGTFSHDGSGSFSCSVVGEGLMLDLENIAVKRAPRFLSSDNIKVVIRQKGGE